jgi:hypothetical protein
MICILNGAMIVGWLALANFFARHTDINIIIKKNSITLLLIYFIVPGIEL